MYVRFFLTFKMKQLQLNKEFEKTFFEINVYK